MTETFDFVEACVRMKAGKIVQLEHNMPECRDLLCIIDGEIKQAYEREPDDWFVCHLDMWFVSRSMYTEYIPTVSGKEAICAFIDDPSLKVRCVDWPDANWKLGRNGETIYVSGRGGKVYTGRNMTIDLKNYKWTIEKGDE